MKTSIALNAGLFYTVWITAVLGSAQLMIWPVLLSCGLLLAWQLHPSRRHPTDLRVLFAALILGLLADSLWLSTGLLAYTDQRPIAAISPLWIIALWAAFALTINHSFYWLKNNPYMPFLSGGIGGPLSYYAGVRFGAVEYLEGTALVSICLAIGWTIAILILVRVSRTKSAHI